MAIQLDHGFATVFGRGLVGELRHIAAPPFLIVTMPDLWELFAASFEGAERRPYLVRSLERQVLERDAAGLDGVRAIVGLGGGRALDAAKYFAWRRGLPLFQVPTALSVDAAFSHRAAVRDSGQVLYRGYARPEAVFIDYDLLRGAPPMLNWSGVADVLCFHTAVLDWRYAESVGGLEARSPYDAALAEASIARVRAVIEAADEIRDLSDAGIQTLVAGLQWGGGSHLAAGWSARHIEGCEHFFFYALEALTRRSFLHGQPVGLGVVVGSMLHDDGADLMLDAMVRIGLDVRPEAMGVSWNEAAEALIGLKAFVAGQPLWRSIVHDVAINPDFVADLEAKLAAAYAHKG
jgi:glycerol-1-phosphate dehydrogenase [NAD(P)+]